MQATKDCMVETGQKAADIAVRTGNGSLRTRPEFRAVKGSVHASVPLVQKLYVCGEGHAQRAAGLFALLKPFLRMLRSVSKGNLPGYVGFFQFLRSFRQHHACEQAELMGSMGANHRTQG
jgi:hypothetical protein